MPTSGSTSWSKLSARWKEPTGRLPAPRHRPPRRNKAHTCNPAGLESMSETGRDQKGRLLGVDYGSVRVGLAVSDPDRKFAFPLTTYERRDSERDAAWFRATVAEEEV